MVIAPVEKLRHMWPLIVLDYDNEMSRQMEEGYHLIQLCFAFSKMAGVRRNQAAAFVGENTAGLKVMSYNRAIMETNHSLYTYMCARPNFLNSCTHTYMYVFESEELSRAVRGTNQSLCIHGSRRLLFLKIESLLGWRFCILLSQLSTQLTCPFL